jgi:hypothetical protein
VPVRNSVNRTIINDFLQRKKLIRSERNFIMIFQKHSELENVEEANEMYDAIKERKSTRILGAI